MTMLVFVDFIGGGGGYRDSAAPSWLHPNLPLEVIAGGGFLDAVIGGAIGGSRGGAPSAFVYHVERGVYVSGKRLSDTAVSPLDTLVVIRCQKLAIRDPEVLDALWQRHGGATRRLEHSGMAAGERRALVRFAH